jgi:16S rRNA (guanine527-N7)-methyltransferase
VSGQVAGSGLAGDELRALLTAARELGFLGPGPIEDHLAHAGGFIDALRAAGAADPAVLVDLGSGGGVPGLVLLVRAVAGRVVLVESMARRAAFLREAVTRLGAADRAVVVEDRAEVVGRGPLRGTVEVVVARGFGAPAVVAECAAPLLRIGGLLVVSEPPDEHDRWPAGALDELGLAPAGSLTAPFHYRWLRQATACPARYPRPVGRPAKRPLF